MRRRILPEERDEAVRGLALDGNPGALTGTFSAGIIASTSVHLLASSRLWLPAVLFAWLVTMGFALTWARHRRTMRLWREQESERLMLAEAERIGREPR